MTTRINKSWREQRKGLVAMWGDRKEEYRSIWEACQKMGAVYGCKPDTARKEIKRAVMNGVARYDRVWTWAAEPQETEAGCGDQSPHTGEE